MAGEVPETGLGGSVCRAGRQVVVTWGGGGRGRGEERGGRANQSQPSEAAASGVSTMSGRGSTAVKKEVKVEEIEVEADFIGKLANNVN